MAYIIEGEHRPVIYCANYRVGSMSTKDTLIEMGGRKVRPGSQHHDAPEEIPGNALVVETVRDHLSVIESSWYFDGCPEWKDYLDMILADEHRWIRIPKMYNRFKSNYILRYENLQFEFDVLCQIAGLEQTPLRVSNQSERVKKCPMHYKQKATLRKIYKEEMEKLGYGGS